MSSASSLHMPADEAVVLFVTHSNLKSFSPELRFSLQTRVAEVKDKLWKKSGTGVDSMRLELYDDSNSKICDLDDDLRPLGFYCAQDRYRLHIVDLDPSSVTAGGWLDDTEHVEKYTISEEAYSKLDTNFRKFKERMMIQNPILSDKKLPENYMEDVALHIKVGDRCEVEPGAKRGTVKFIGKSEPLGPGFWVGLEYDEPLGKNDGMVKGVRFFSCAPGHGAIVRPDKIKVGDFPERDPFEEEI